MRATVHSALNQAYATGDPKRAPPARESGPEAGVRPSGRRSFAVRGSGGNPDRDAPRAAAQPGTSALLDQSD
jgi:hypothetical protein